MDDRRGDAVPPAVERQRARYPFQAEFAGGVGDRVGPGHLRRQAADIDDAPAPARLHRLQGFAAAEEGGGEIDVDHFAPPLQRQLDGRAMGGDAGAGDEERDGRERLGIGEEAGDIGFVGDVGGADQHPVAAGRQLSGQRFQAIRAPGGKHQARAARGEGLRDARPYSGTGAGDDGGMARKILHFVFLRVMRGEGRGRRGPCPCSTCSCGARRALRLRWSGRSAPPALPASAPGGAPAGRARHLRPRAYRGDRARARRETRGAARWRE